MNIKLFLSVVLFLLLLTMVSMAQEDDVPPISFEFYTIDTPLSVTGLDPACMGKDEAFLPFGDVLSVHCDETFMYIEAFTIAEHPMMVGITAWNGQVPIPHRLTQDNSWRIPMNPDITGENTPTVGQGPIAVAINGVMIFNPTKQDGIYSDDSDPYLIGELDVCGGHSGRGDDYHYHIAPICLVEHLAEDSDGMLPIAYAMDGFPIYGFTNADGSAPVLDECNGEFDDEGNYHYHATEDYPYINGCFKGTFDMSLQPAAHPIRVVEGGGPAQILITALYQDETGWIHMEYEYQGTLLSVNYREVDDSCFEYQFVDNVKTGAISATETYCRSDTPPNGDNPPPPNDGNPPPSNDGNPPPPPPSD